MARIEYFTDQILEENADQNILMQKNPGRTQFMRKLQI